MNYLYIKHFKKSHKNLLALGDSFLQRTISTLSGDNRKTLGIYIDNQFYCPRDPLLFIHSAER